MGRLKDKVRLFPDLPGVYLIKDKNNRVIYVGKASSLRRRALSYFSRRLAPAKTRMMAEARAFDYITASCEASALILEAALIKEMQPRYNIELKDDKSYPYVEISREDYPYLAVTRRRAGGRYFGPYAQAKLLKEALSLLRKIFPYRSCRRLPAAACLYYDLRLCPGPCVHKIDKRLYRQNLKGIIMVLEGKRKQLEGRLAKEMAQKSRRLEFEAAAQIKQKLEALRSLYLPQDEILGVVDLKEALGLRRLPLRLEAVDLSNLSGRQRTGAVVVFVKGRAQPREYRRFRIKEGGRDDLSMMAEVVRRRLQRRRKEGRPMPDLFVLDGGPSHIAAVQEVVAGLGEEIEIVALAKRGRDKIWQPQRHTPLYLPPSSLALRLLQRARDEAHRFARKYHMLLRRKGAYE